MTTTSIDRLAALDAKADHYWQEAERLTAQQAQLIRDGHRDRANRLQDSIDSMRAAASRHAGLALQERMRDGVPTGGEA